MNTAPIYEALRALHDAGHAEVHAAQVTMTVRKLGGPDVEVKKLDGWLSRKTPPSRVVQPLRNGPRLAVYPLAPFLGGA